MPKSTTIVPGRINNSFRGYPPTGFFISVSMAMYCVAYVGKFNEPLYFYSKEEASETLHFQMIVHSCLDVVEERKKRYLNTRLYIQYFGM